MIRMKRSRMRRSLWLHRLGNDLQWRMWHSRPHWWVKGTPTLWPNPPYRTQRYAR
jgi:hypothetical protein